MNYIRIDIISHLRKSPGSQVMWTDNICHTCDTAHDAHEYMMKRYGYIPSPEHSLWRVAYDLDGAPDVYQTDHITVTDVAETPIENFGDGHND